MFIGVTPQYWTNLNTDLKMDCLYIASFSWILHRWATSSHEQLCEQLWLALKCRKPMLKYPCNGDYCTVYPKKYAHGFVVLCFVVVMQSFIMNSHEVFIHIHQGCFAGTGAIVRLPQCQWSKPDGYGKISQCITTTKHSKAKTVCIFLGIYCNNKGLVGYILTISIVFDIRLSIALASDAIE